MNVELIASLKPELPHRKRLRLAGFDYSELGAYFVTICTRNRQHLLGEIEDGQMKLNPRGEAVKGSWNDIPNYFTGIALDAFVILPNHVHGILLFTDDVGAAACPARPVRARSLPVVVGSFKSAASRQIGASIWQRNYWERIIRNEDELNRIRTYIDENLLRWPTDSENTEFCCSQMS
jgi:putative transposase